MIFHVQVEATSQGDYLATCADPKTNARGVSRDAALDLLREEIRYQIEVCPCASVEDDFVELQVEE